MIRKHKILSIFIILTAFVFLSYQVNGLVSAHRDRQNGERFAGTYYQYNSDGERVRKLTVPENTFMADQSPLVITQLDSNHTENWYPDYDGFNKQPNLFMGTATATRDGKKYIHVIAFKTGSKTKYKIYYSNAVETFTRADSE